jgi:hypothetical protein
MPKNLGTLTTTQARVRSIDSFQVTARSTGDLLDVYPLVEQRNPDTNALEGTEHLPPQRFSQDEIEAALSHAPELPQDYDNLRVGLAKLMHALLDAR